MTQTSCGIREGVREPKENSRSLHFATPDFLWTLVALADVMRLSLRERRTRGFVQSCVAGNPGTLRSGLVTFLIWPVVCGWKARKSICQQASPGFPRLCSGQALRLRAVSRPLCDRPARRFAQDDGFVGGEKHPVRTQKTRKDRKSHRLSLMTSGAWGKRGRPLKPKEGLNGPPKTLIAGVASFVIHLSTRLRESAARDDKGKGEASMESGC
jgi:hypothetical protein